MAYDIAPRTKTRSRRNRLRNSNRNFGTWWLVAGCLEALLFEARDVRRVRATLPDISGRKLCCMLHVARSTLHRTKPRSAARPKLSADLVTKLHALIQAHPTYGYRHCGHCCGIERDSWSITKRCITSYGSSTGSYINEPVPLVLEPSGCEVEPHRVFSGGLWIRHIFPVAR